MNTIIKEIRKELKANSDINTRQSGQKFFKEEIKAHGVKTALVKKIAKTRFKNIKFYDKTKIFDLCETLWQSEYIEESFIACHWSYLLRKDYEPCDFKVFENWVEKYVTNWASCDTLCNPTIGAFLELYPNYV